MINYIFDLDDTIIMHNGRSVNYNLMDENPLLTYYLKQCKGPKYIYTNGTYSHADTVLKRMNLSDEFEKIYSRDTIYLMKPSLSSAVSVQRDITFHNNDQNNKYIFFDDLLSNLEMGKKLGWKTIWIHPDFHKKIMYNYVDKAYPDLVTALRELI
jgi:putative hydrolase of the HAD superfamily